MSFNPGFQSKIDVLDLLISILKDHEENLSDSIDKMDRILQDKNPVSEKEPHHPLAFVDCLRWSGFKRASAGASLVGYRIDIWNEFTVVSVGRRFIFGYSEKLPRSEDDITLEDTVCGKVLGLDSIGLRHWLAEELKVPETKIIEGNIEELTRHADERRYDGRHVITDVL